MNPYKITVTQEVRQKKRKPIKIDWGQLMLYIFVCIVLAPILFEDILNGNLLK